MRPPRHRESNRTIWPLFGLLVFAVPPVSAQVGVTTDLITGVVVGMDGSPLEGVIIEATSFETEITRATRTDRNGRYTILFPDGGGQYQITARMVGVAPQQTTLVRHADEDRLVWDVQLAEPLFVLDEIEVNARAPRVINSDRPTPGSVERSLTADQIAKLPIDVEDLNILASLIPGVVPIAGTDSGSAAFSVAGQRPDANSITLDGMRFESGQVPQEGLRNTRVISSTYDVARGGFSGGQIASTTRSGANRIQGTANYSLRDDQLSFESAESPFSSAFTLHQVGAGLGGPLIPNRLFAYLSGQARLRNDPLTALTSATGADLTRLGISPDSVGRFLNIVDGIGAAGTRTATDRDNNRVSALLRMDYLVSGTQTLTFRGDWRGSIQEPSRISALALPETGGDDASGGGGGMLALSSQFGTRLINEARFLISAADRTSDPFLYTPQGRVQVSSELADGTVGINTLVLGGNPRMPVSSNTTSLELSDEVSWLPGAGSHRFKLGGRFVLDQSINLLATNQFGTFTFNSLEDLESGSPASFRRTLAPSDRGSDALEWGVYAADVWRASRAFQLTYGLRLEGSKFRNPPPYNEALDASLGIRTDRLPSEIDVSPRAGFTWTIGNIGLGGTPTVILRGGVGKFRSPIPANLVAQTQTATGLSTSEQDLNCIGRAVPIPDWDMYRQQPDAIPVSCIGAATPLDSRAPSATLFASDFNAPKSWRGSLSAQRNLTTLLSLSASADYARGIGQYGFRDLNLDTRGGFTLGAENDRPVFVDPEAIVSQTGAVRLTDSRVDPEFAQVLEVGSDLESETRQVSLSLGGVTRTGIVMRTSYTWSSVRDQSSQSVRGGTGTLDGATTAGNPNEREWSRSSFERRHSFLTTISYPFGTLLEITAIGRLNSGTPFTPMVASDINGDGARNDRAFVFPLDGPATPVAMADAMSHLMRTTSAGARNCLANAVGRIADRNSCTGPWQAALDLQMNYRPTFLSLNGNLSVSLVTVNMLRGIDELLHGADGAKGWGLEGRPDQVLLFVDGFDPATNSFVYSVNERFGATGTNTNAFRNPFQLGIQMRWSFGPNRQRAALDGLRGGRGGFGNGGGDAGFAGRGGGAPGAGPGRGPGGGGAFGGALGSPEEFIERFGANFVNPADVIIGLRDTLDLTDAQVAAIQLLGDSLNARTAALADDLRRQFEEVGSEDLRALVSALRPMMAQGQTHARETVAQIRELLTDAQWNKLPDAVRNPGTGRGLRRRQ